MADAKMAKRKRWRETRHNGRACVVSPDGRVFYGTAQEVRAAALTPTARNGLAWALATERILAQKFALPFERVNARARSRRRNAIGLASTDALVVSHMVPMTEADYIRLCAGARLRGFGSTGDYFRSLVRIEIEGLLDLAEMQTGKREIPLTRHERAAVERLARETA